MLPRPPAAVKLDGRRRALHAAAMRIALSLLLFQSLLPAQVALPGGTGSLRPGPEWTVLQSSELTATERSTDPAAEPARGFLRAIIDELRRGDRAATHMLLHALGPGGELRVMNLWSAPGSASGAQLLAASTVDGMQKTLQPGLEAAGTTVTYDGHADPLLFTNGSVRLRFRCQRGELGWQVDHHLVPAGENLQYCEALTFPGDVSAVPAVEAVLRTFDGARDGKSGTSMLLPLALGGILGGLCGVMAGRWRQRRLAAARSQRAE
jgi:hypothetical protein